jgi:putative membrane protein
MAPGSPTDEPRDAADPEDHEPDVQLSFANERTFLAWQRTALGLITAGLAITQLLPSFDFPGARRLIGLPLIGLGVVIAAVSYWEWHANQEAMRHDRPLPRSRLPLAVAVVVGLVAVIGFVLVIVEGSG